MARRWAVSSGTKVIEFSAAKVAVGGVVKPITKACVAMGGTVRQFWLPQAGTNVPEINWNNTPATVTQYAIAPNTAAAQIIFTRDNGQYQYDNYPYGYVLGIYINPAPSALLQYWIKVDQVSGDALTGTLGSWIDIYSAASHQWSLDLATIGTSTALANITIAPDDGGGSPDTTKQSVKPVTFNAEVSDISKIAWSTLQHDLLEVKTSVDADCTVTFSPNGTVVGSADTSGSFTENWHEDAPNAKSPEFFWARATLVSGDTPEGLLSAALDLQFTRQWRLVATSGEDKSCTLDIEVSDGDVVITKRITMNSIRQFITSYNIWSDTPTWLQIDDSPLGGQVTLTVSNDGTVNFTNGTPAEDLNQDWHSQAPTPSEPENYECKLQLISGDSSLMSGSAINTWLPLNVNQTFNATGIAGLLREFRWDLSVRKIGDIAETKRITAYVGTEDTL